HVLDMEALKDAVPGATLVMGTARAGEAANMVPPRARMTVDGRAPSAEAMAALVAAVEAGLENPSRRVPGTTTTVEGGPTRPPMPRTVATARLFELARESALRLGFDVGEEATGGGSDGNLLAAAGLPVLDGLGPVGGATHSRHEFVLADSLAPRTAMLASLIARVGAGGLAAE
ncbi:MAG: M20/M25/M40 family metallo-hydrolase, partial [Anaerolineae bacterium]